MISANELMIGDYVLYQGNPNRVYRILPDTVPFADAGKMKEDLVHIVWNDTHDQVNVNNLEPIPLTPCVLLTNGFERQELGGNRVAIWTGFGEDNCHDIEIEFDGDKPIHLKIDGPVYLVTPNIKYVHQLQHFLRDCETGKEIEL